MGGKTRTQTGKDRLESQDKQEESYNGRPSNGVIPAVLTDENEPQGVSCNLCYELIPVANSLGCCAAIICEECTSNLRHAKCPFCRKELTEENLGAIHMTWIGKLRDMEP